MRIMEKMAARAQSVESCAPILIAFLGDSVTHGCFEVSIDGDKIGAAYDGENAYPRRLQRQLDMLYPASAASILNAGVSGACAVDGLKRLDRDVLRRNPDLVIIAFALNDAMNPDREAGLTAYRAAMESMIQRTQASGAECIVQTPNHMCSYVSAKLKEQTLRGIAAQAVRVQREGVLADYAQTAREAAAACGVPVADAHHLWERLAQSGADTTALLSNHINHPTRDAHDFFMTALLNAMLGD